jgi:uncharacterized protein (DUF433 family)
MSKIGAFTEDAASRLSGVSVGQLRAWRRNGFFAPGIISADGVPYGQIYSFEDVAALRVLNGLRNESKCPMDHLRKVRESLAGMGNERWLHTRLYVVNREVVFVPDDTARPESVVGGQGVLTIVLADVLEDLEADIRKLNARDLETHGKISRSRHVMRNAPVIAGTRIPVSTVLSWIDAGYSDAAIIEQYPDLVPADIDAAKAHGAQKAA